MIGTGALGDGVFWPGVSGAGLLGALAGAAAGAAVRVLLGRMARGTRVRVPVCEVAVAAPWAAVVGAWAAGVLPGRWVPVLLGTAWFGVAAGLVDLRHHRLPDALTLPAVPAALLLVTPLGPDAVGRAVPGVLLAAGVHAAVHLAAPGALGAGDVKLAASLGAPLAVVSWPALLLAAVLASVLTLGRAAACGRRAVPHGPSMVVGSAVVLVAAAAGAGGPW
ncbi:prepilin peptidase [Pseudonocardia abyssalis]|uniref:Prepilin peptidase n=1 Tax=Pseudonocardia abyssalis TaxID=2792008 RepID=A0ABS6UQ26_9PSEU|nr:A24 family peptidase [Pseudonocardia abyssalis]MBW0134363.1 prepilin peptidase [Pseudonocardia abyssalis]